MDVTQAVLVAAAGVVAGVVPAGPSGGRGQTVAGVRGRGNGGMGIGVSISGCSLNMSI